MPKFRQIHKRAGEYIHDWGVALAAEAGEYSRDRVTKSLKRGSEDDEGSAPAKKKIKAETDGALLSMSAEGLKSLISRDGLKKCVVADLKEFCKAKGLNATGKKQDFIDRIEGWAENQ